jgi:predicted NUDIX family phosphoesterase/predicted ATPase
MNLTPCLGPVQCFLVKSELQKRAEALAEEFKLKGRKPVVIEFAGTPKAGKTTTLGTLNAFLKRCGFKVEVVIERASVCPIRDKKHGNFNIWTACTTLAQVLEKTQNPPRHDDPDVLILDRGLFDSVAWLRMMAKMARIKQNELEAAENFLLLPEWQKRISGVIVMTSSATDAMQREEGDLPVEGVTGSIMNPEMLEKFRANTAEACKRLAGHFRIFQISTSDITHTKKQTAEKVASIVLDLIAEQLDEEILCANKVDVIKLFGGKASVVGEAALPVSAHFATAGLFVARAEAEKTPDLVQALPVVVVRTKSGQVLQLRRREKTPANPLHNKVVIWAGGHVRKEDSNNGQSLIQCALREVHEELRLSLDASGLKLLGAIYTDLGKTTSQHVAIVYEWRAETDDVVVVLSNTEFGERRGTSLSGKFVDVKDLVGNLSAPGKNIEPWSEEIIRHFLGADSAVPDKLLF